MTKSEEKVANAFSVKQKKGKKILKVIGICFGVVAVLCGICAIVSAIGYSSNSKLVTSFSRVELTDRIVPETDSEGNWIFTTDRELKILQLTDIHLGGGFMSIQKDANAINAVAAMVQAEKPDLVIATGDIAYPVPFQAGTFNNKTGAKLFSQLMNTLGVYWTVSFGNHDSEIYSYFSREKISDFYSGTGSEYCLYTAGPDEVDGFGNQIIKVKNSSGATVQGLVILDSHSYTDGDFLGIKWLYDNIHQNQVEWYKNEILKMKAENGGKTVPSMAFFHIPLTEFKVAWEEFIANGYKDTADTKYKEGIIGETGRMVYSGVGDDLLFETMLELGSTKAIFNGHDHFNNITLNYKGIDFCYGYSVDNLAYIGISKKGSQRGCTVITVKPDASYEINKYNLYTSGRYTLPQGLDDDVSMQFEGVTYRYIEEK